MFVILGVFLIIIGDAEVFFICTISAFFHECGHSIVAGRYGYKMDKIRLMPFGAELCGETDCFDGKDEIWISIAGPIVNFGICIIILGLWWLKPEIYGFSYKIFDTNLVMGIFNMLPFFPLDGGRVLLSVLSNKLTRRESAKIVKFITKIFAITLFLLFLITLLGDINITMGIMAFFLFFVATSSANDATYQKISLKKLITERCVRWDFMSVPNTYKIFELKKYHIKNCVIMFIVVDYMGREQFRFSEIDIEKIETRLKPTQLVGEIKRFLTN